MIIRDVVDRIIRVSGRSELQTDRPLILNALNDYKLYLQRDKRIAFSQTTATLTVLAGARTVALPADYLMPIALRRAQATECGNVLLTRWLNREEFFTCFPLLRDGLPYTGAPNIWITMANLIVFGPILTANETFYLDYYQLLPRYEPDELQQDDFVNYFNDGLHVCGLKWIFAEWTPDAKMEEKHQKRLDRLELGIRKYQVSREEPMESTLNLPDL